MHTSPSQVLWIAIIALVVQVIPAMATEPAAAPATPAATGEVLSSGEGSLEGPIDPKRYRLGPGDLLHVRIEADQMIDRRILISPEGFLILSEGPSIRLAGVPLNEAQQTVTAALAPYYRKARVQIHLLELRSFGVYAVGNVVEVGMYRATAVSRASEIIARAGGVDEDGSLRRIRLLRVDETEVPVDLGLFLETGRLEHNPFVEAGDRIYVPPRGNLASISGAVEVPGEFEVIPGDSVAVMVALAHGLREDARPDSVYLESFEGSRRTSIRRRLDLRLPEDRAVPIRARDVIFVPRIPDWSEMRTVLVDGEVHSPGLHALPADSLPLTDVIAMANGFTERASLHEAVVIRPLGDRPPDPEFERLSALPSTEMTPEEYEFYRMKLRSQRQAMSVDFAQLFNAGDDSHNISVRPGDEIHVPPLRAYVTIVGEVVRPGNIPFNVAMTVDEYIQHAGGFTTRAAKGDVAVIRALTGEWVESADDVQLGPGDTVWVPRKPRRHWGDISMRTLAVVSQVATVYLLVDAATK